MPLARLVSARDNWQFGQQTSVAQFASRPDFMPDRLRGITEIQNHETLADSPDPRRTGSVDRWFFVARACSNTLSGADELQ